MNGDDASLREEDICYQILGCAMAVAREIGHGLHEKPYENALVVALEEEHVPFEQQPSYRVEFRGRKVGEYIPDLVVDERVIVDTKVIDRITGHERGQMINYLRITGLTVGLIINFKHAKLQWERVVL
ncbi:GxxExxY protein [Actomonas aquatica]|uniref:GxxExxY protein n=1 Tax=Actomonas aquatica TaxID=2866162 RepID=A0ABZ1C321_9BACT|nr:GxxExxY protein [Opitutus sp. WL0086]WRQ85653.1 GxxExxY protein [Opitutus sp. WL0086]